MGLVLALPHPARRLLDCRASARRTRRRRRAPSPSPSRCSARCRRRSLIPTPPRSARPPRRRYGRPTAARRMIGSMPHRLVRHGRRRRIRSVGSDDCRRSPRPSPALAACIEYSGACAGRAPAPADGAADRRGRRLTLASGEDRSARARRRVIIRRNAPQRTGISPRFLPYLRRVIRSPFHAG